MTNRELPKMDLPEEWLIGTGINKDLLSSYTNFPCRLKSEIFVLYMDGGIEASVNLDHSTVHANGFIAIIPGSIVQIYSLNGEPALYFGGSLSKCIEQASLSHVTIDTLFVTLERPIISLKPEGIKLLREYLHFLIKLCSFFDETTHKSITPHLYNNMRAGIAAMYESRLQNTTKNLSKNELIYKNFTQLMMQNYNQARNVAWCAEKLGTTHNHLCTIVKQVTGNTCVEITSRMIIMDAKSQLKSTRLSI